MTTGKTKIDRERSRLSLQLDRLLDVPIAVLGLLWAALFVVEMLGVERRWVTIAGVVIWMIFILDFAARMWIAPRRLEYLRKNWLSLISLLLPALGAFRFVRALRAARAVRGLRLARYLTSVNRGLRALRLHLRRRGLTFVLLATLLVIFTTAAAAYVFERDGGNERIGASYADALWWSAMIVTTLGSEAWPETVEGRILCFFLAAYTFGIFGYLTAALASFFVGRDARDSTAAKLARLEDTLSRIEDRIGDRSQL